MYYIMVSLEAKDIRLVGKSFCLLNNDINIQTSIGPVIAIYVIAIYVYVTIDDICFCAN